MEKNDKNFLIILIEKFISIGEKQNEKIGELSEKIEELRNELSQRTCFVSSLKEAYSTSLLQSKDCVNCVTNKYHMYFGIIIKALITLATVGATVAAYIWINK